MRGITAFAICMLALGAVAQQKEPGPLGESQPSPNLFLTDKQDITIVARKHNLGSDILTVTVEDTFPREELTKRITKLGGLLKSDILAMRVENYNPNPQNKQGGYLRAEFGVKGLIDRDNSALGLQTLTRAFAGDPIDSLFVQYETEAPNTKLVQQWRAPDGSVLVQGRASPQFGLEYKIKTFTKDTDSIRIPEGAEAEAEQKAPPKPTPPQPSQWWIWPLIVVAALALGALVYSLLIRPRPSARH